MAAQDVQPPTNKSLSFNSINHLKLPCFSIQKSVDFYTTILPFEHIPKYDHFTPEHKLFARMIHFKELILEFRYLPEQAAAQKGWDPITWGVDTRTDLEKWGQWLDTNGVKRSRVFTGIKGWVMSFEDPDGRIVRLYVDKEEHEWIDNPDQDEFWLGKVQADPALAG